MRARLVIDVCAALLERAPANNSSFCDEELTTFVHKVEKYEEFHTFQESEVTRGENKNHHLHVAMVTFVIVFGIAGIICVYARYKNHAFYAQDRINRDVDRGNISRYLEGTELAYAPQVATGEETEELDEDART
jgi:hypothetical protein